MNYEEIVQPQEFCVKNIFKGTEYVGVFSVTNNKRVAFAPGNLQYIPTADTWLFAANQYDYIGTRNMVNQAFAEKIYGFTLGNTVFKDDCSVRCK